MLSTAILGFSAGLIGELVIRGGLDTDWRLPIVEDTQISGTARVAGSPETATLVPCPIASRPPELRDPGRSSTH